MTPLYGLVLAGGSSSRMQRDKAAIGYGRRPQLQVAYDLLHAFVDRTFVSVRAEQRDDPLRSALPQIVDGAGPAGPIAGILAALRTHPQAAWLAVACDLPLLDAATLSALLAGRDPGRLATAFASSRDGQPEPLCAIYEPDSAAALQAFIAAGGHCPRQFLLRHEVALLTLPDPHALDNVNTPADLADAERQLRERGAA